MIKIEKKIKELRECMINLARIELNKLLGINNDL